MGIIPSIGLYLIVCWFIVLAFGSHRILGAWKAFAYCVFLSPLIGFIVILRYGTKGRSEFIAQQSQSQKQQLKIWKDQNANGGSDLSLELESLSRLRRQGLLTDEEFENAKEKLVKL